MGWGWEWGGLSREGIPAEAFAPGFCRPATSPCNIDSFFDITEGHGDYPEILITFHLHVTLPDGSDYQNIFLRCFQVMSFRLSECASLDCRWNAVFCGFYNDSKCCNRSGVNLLLWIRFPNVD